MTRLFSATHLIAIALIAGAFGLGFFSGPALAEEQVQPDQAFDFPFYYSPAELASTPKAEKLLTRLERAVRRECGANQRMTFNERAFAQACIEKTMSDSVAKFGSETVAQAYKSRTVG